MNVLITTLGRARPLDSEKRGPGRYETVQYQFDGSVASRPTPFFGVVLKEYLETTGMPIDKISILGTSTSMWDAWLEIDENIYVDNENLAGRLAELTGAEGVSADDLQGLSRVLSEHLGIRVECSLIPYGMNEEEQLEILQIISRSANDGDNVYMDVTHGFRHLPMLELQSAFLMSSRFTTKGIYYAAFDRRTAEGYVPVISLSGAMKINNWCCAVATLKETGNVSSLARLSGMEAFREDLLKCQFFEQMNDVAQSRRHARAILDHLPDLPPEGRLFETEIRRVFDWGGEQRYARRQYEQARKAFENGDYLRSVILLMEATISAHMQGDVTNADNRAATQENLKRSLGNEWHCLRRLRNSLAHGGAPTGRGAAEVISMRKSEEDFKRGMESLMEWVERILP